MKKISKIGAATLEALIMFPLWCFLILMCVAEYEHSITAVELEEDARIALRVGSRQETYIDAISTIDSILASKNCERVSDEIYEKNLSSKYVKTDNKTNPDVWTTGNLIEIKVIKRTKLYNDKFGVIKWGDTEYDMNRATCTTTISMIIESPSDSSGVITN